MLEGTFTDAVTVSFPGGATVPATLLGSHRARVAVPAAATQGNLTVISGGMVVGSLTFRRASFPLGMGQFSANYEQDTIARQDVVLETARQHHTSITIGDHLYVIGGTDNNSSLISIERAIVNADGSLGSFARVSNVNLVAARHAHSVSMIGNNVYVIGGRSAAPLASIEVATVSADRTLDTFSEVAGISLVTARYGHASAIIGNHLYVLGGFGNTSLDSVERAAINVDGSLGPFMTLPGVSLTMARHGHAAQVAGNYLYILGGIRGNSPLKDVERAAINADGSLGPFAPVPSASLATERSGHTVEVLGNRLYVVGGTSSSGSLSSVEAAPLSDTGSVGSFTTIPDIALTTGRHNHTTSVIGNYIYNIGGILDNPLNTVERATLNTAGAIGSFVTVPDVVMPTERSSPVGVVLGSSVYLIGGAQFLTFHKSIDRATVSSDSAIRMIAPVDETSLSTGRGGYAIAVLGNHLYAIGGFGVNNSERAAIGTGGSLQAFLALPGIAFDVERFNFTPAVVRDHLYIIGGLNSNFIPLDSIERARIGTDNSLGTFSVVQNVTLTTARQSHSSVRIANFLYVIGGTNKTIVNNTSPLDSIERATIDSNGTLGPFSSLTGIRLLTGRHGHSSLTAGGYLYVIGGMGANGTLNSIERARILPNGELGPFSAATGITLVRARSNATVVAIGNYVYIVGGDFNAELPDTVERATLIADDSL